MFSITFCLNHKQSKWPEIKVGLGEIGSGIMWRIGKTDEWSEPTSSSGSTVRQKLQ